MKKIVEIIFVVCMALTLFGCDQYDPERINRDIDEMEALLNSLEGNVQILNQQMTTCNELLNSKFISLITVDENGRYVINYKSSGGEFKSVTIATKNDMVTLPLIGIGEFQGEYYWRITVDKGDSYEWLLDDKGNKVSVTGQVPDIAVDSEGYWTIDGVRVKDKDNNPILANDISNTLFKEIEIDEETGFAIFTLADGTQMKIQIMEALGIRFDVAPVTAIIDRTNPVRIGYTVVGSESDDAIVDCFTAYNVTATVDNASATITVTLNPAAESGNIIVMVHANGNTILKPLFFTYGSAEIRDPELDPRYTSGGIVLLEGELTSFDIKVSANIEYNISVSDDAKSWLSYNTDALRAAIVTTTHTFTAGNYQNDLGVSRTGTITFTNKPYNISATVTVKQNPAQSQPEGGISSAAALVAFANAVNAGGSISKWQDNNGEVILLNDIDMAEITSWAPVGNATGNYTAATAFSGIFNGKGFAIKNIQWDFDVTDGQLVYGLFGALKDATVKNLVIGSDDGSSYMRCVGASAANTSVGSLAGYSETSTIQNVKNYVKINFAGDNLSGQLTSLGGIVGTMKGGIIGGATPALGCRNYGDVITGKITNESNGAAACMTIGGICALMQASDAKIDNCVNQGGISAPTGRGGGICGTGLAGVTISNTDNYGTVQDDAVGQYAGKPLELTYNVKRQGGIMGGNAASGSTYVTIEYCTNYGNVFTHLGCRTGGFVGHNTGLIRGCVNNGAILGDLYVEGNGTNRHGPGWACGYSAASSATYINVSGCTKGGYVGGYTEYKDNPALAPGATNENAFCHNPSAYDPSINN
ncbi:MAG: hypothetical protein LBU22_15380 [Dysgonamonadaceae bacterium]|jgi:hypothetical protein|nr:hypothetical protein [Dysgonamonadaceae bacterium]